ncbi:MAG: hypothetical protein HFJ94_06505 [Muribaculaceae bacterium]|nr:hypothetical protein [Muribaculaceae bacterium]
MKLQGKRRIIEPVVFNQIRIILIQSAFVIARMTVVRVSVRHQMIIISSRHRQPAVAR